MTRDKSFFLFQENPSGLFHQYFCECYCCCMTIIVKLLQATCHWHSTLASQVLMSIYQLWVLPLLLFITFFCQIFCFLYCCCCSASATNLRDHFSPSDIFYLTLLPWAAIINISLGASRSTSMAAWLHVAVQNTVLTKLFVLITHQSKLNAWKSWTC